MSDMPFATTPVIERITRRMLSEKLRAAEISGSAGIIIGTGHLRLTLDLLSAALDRAENAERRAELLEDQIRQMHEDARQAAMDRDLTD